MKLTRFTENRTLEEANDLYKQRISDAIDIYKLFYNQFIARCCPACDCSKIVEMPKFIGLYGVSRCARCQTLFVNPCPNNDALVYYYNESNCNKMLNKLFIKRQNSNSGGFILNNRLELISRLIKSSFISKDNIRILEIGCGSGINLSNVKRAFEEWYPEKKFSFCGIDIDGNAIAQKVDASLNLFAIDCESCVKEFREKFDIIMHFELIEHLINPIEFMRSLKKLCHEDTFVAFTTPNSSGLEMLVGYNEFRLLAHSIFPPMHLNAYSVNNVGFLALTCGYSVFEVETPGMLDVDIINNSISGSYSSLLKGIANLDEKSQVVLQQVCQALKVSSHMQVIFKMYVDAN